MDTASADRNKGLAVAPDTAMIEKLLSKAEATLLSKNNDDLAPILGLGQYLRDHPEARPAIGRAMREARRAAGGGPLKRYWSAGTGQKAVVVVATTAIVGVVGLLVWQGVSLFIESDGPFSRLFGGE